MGYHASTSPNIRQYTNAILAAIDEGWLSADLVARACLGYMSEAEVKDMCQTNDILFNADDDDGEEE